MTAIEVYQKIATAIEGAEPKDVLFAIDFIRNETQDKFYRQQESTRLAGQIGYANQAGLANAVYTQQYAAKIEAQNAEAVAKVREIVRDEIKAANPNVEPVAA